jgi:hypothetical protein
VVECQCAESKEKLMKERLKDLCLWHRRRAKAGGNIQPENAYEASSAAVKKNEFAACLSGAGFCRCL